MKARQVLNEINKVILGKENIVERIWMCILARGHVLLEDIPGVGKTSLALAFSRALQIQFQRIQFTPDVVASDVVGFMLFDPELKKFRYQPGAVMCNLLLADEINRTSSRTQSALLETMEEKQVTVDSVTYKLPDPFVVIATQNPIGSFGTQHLPSSQLDRFMVQLSIGYPSFDAQLSLLEDRMSSNPLDAVQSIFTREELIQLQNEVERVEVNREVLEYLTRLCERTRNHPALQQGISPRGSLLTARLAKAKAYLSERNFVIPEDIMDVFVEANHHRVLLDFKEIGKSKSTKDVLMEILEEEPAHHEK